MKIRLKDGLPYISVTIEFQGQSITLDKVVLDTGSAGSIFSTDQLKLVGLRAELTDMLHRVQGIGGYEFAFTKRIDRIAVGRLEIRNFDIEVGALGYNPDLDGLLGIDFLSQTQAIIDLHLLEIRQGRP